MIDWFRQEVDRIVFLFWHRIIFRMYYLLTHINLVHWVKKIEKSFEFKWQMLLFTTVQGIVITWMNTAWLIKVMQLAGSLQTKPK